VAPQLVAAARSDGAHQSGLCALRAVCAACNHSVASAAPLPRQECTQPSALRYSPLIGLLALLARSAALFDARSRSSRSSASAGSVHQLAQRHAALDRCTCPLPSGLRQSAGNSQQHATLDLSCHQDLYPSTSLQRTAGSHASAFAIGFGKFVCWQQPWLQLERVFCCCWHDINEPTSNSWL
jgi:hypothetical protein